MKKADYLLAVFMYCFIETYLRTDLLVTIQSTLFLVRVDRMPHAMGRRCITLHTVLEAGHTHNAAFVSFTKDYFKNRILLY
jgi:hypothetical protein